MGVVVPEIDVNFVAVFIATIVSMVIGSLWFSPLLFGKLWIALSGKSQKELAGQKKRGMIHIWILAFVGAFITSYVLYHFTVLLSMETLADALLGAFWIWLGFIAPVQLGIVLWDGKPWKLFVLLAAYHLINLMVIAGVLVLW